MIDRSPTVDRHATGRGTSRPSEHRPNDPHRTRHASSTHRQTAHHPPDGSARRWKRRERAGRISPELTGFPGPVLHRVTGEREDRRPLLTAWISDDLLAETVEVWSEAYRRPVSEDEAVEILLNVKRLGEVILKARREVHQP